MAGPHYPPSSSSLLEFSLSLDPGALLVFFLKKISACFVNGLWSNADRIVALSLEGKGYSFLKSPEAGKISGFLTGIFF